MTRNVRPAQLADLDRLIPLGQRFVAEYVPHLVFNETKTRTSLTVLLTGGHLCFVADEGPEIVGAIGLFLVDHPLSGERVASELFWYVRPESRGIGLRLLLAAEAEAVVRGVAKVHMVALESNRAVELLYRDIGYVRRESTWEKGL